MCCHSACHVRKLARRRLTSNDGSSRVVVIIDLSLPVQEAEDTLSFRVGSLVWGLFCGLFWLLHMLSTGLSTVTLCCFFLLRSLFCECVEVTDKSQLCGCWAFGLAL